jgi:FkbM family methyltransferase
MANPLLTLAAAAARLLPPSVKRAVYKLGPASRGLRAALNKAAPVGLSQVRVAAGGLNGALLMLDLQREKDYWLGTYEMELQQAILDWSQTGSVAYDLGANIGYISLLLARALGAGGKVFAFEALPNNHKRLQKNFSLNPEAKIEIVPKAVADKKGALSFLIHSSGGMGKLLGSSGRDTEYLDHIQVPTISLDEFVYESKQPKPQLIKIDIEGGEVMALPGMRRLLRDARPTLLIELHGREAAEVAWEILNNASYSLHEMKKGYPRIANFKQLGWKSYVVAKPN